ncbi:hypothetical protein PCK1_001647 [Pneumocystis canis]|nr:hypothetical protein PCK1_001647 [Pneumocystis canis]
MDAFKNFHSINLNKTFSGISPLAKESYLKKNKTVQLVRQTIGTADDLVRNLTELPEEYLELEQIINNLKAVHTKLLSVTSTYNNESYDYPANLRETFSEFSKTIQEKVHNLAGAQSATDVQAAIMKPTTKSAPKTLNHALSRAALASSEVLDTSNPLKNFLLAYSDAQNKIGNARLKQDHLISSSFNECLNSNLNTIFQYASKARKNVHATRLSLDTIKSSAKTAKPEKQEQIQRDIEHAEDVFVTAVEDAIQIMKSTLETLELTLQFKELISAQLSFHKDAYEILSSLLTSDLLKKYYH